MISSSFMFLVAYVSLANGGNFLIDNEVLGEPKVDCEDTMLALTFKTRKPFSGRVYVQGLSDDDRCSRSFARNSNQSRFSMMVENGDCTMQRHRVSGKLDGIMFSLTIVVSFHGTFVTKADRAYRCMCFFRSARRLTNSIEIAGLATTELADTAPLPTCSYGIRMGSPDGPPAAFGQVGDSIFHVWECEGNDHGLLVHSCSVTDGKGYKFDLVDLDGCAIDPLIQPNLEYDKSMSRAFAETWGYKFSDTSVLNYECVIELCKKETGECDDLIPASCGRSKRTAQEISKHDGHPKFVHGLKKGDRQTVEVLASINMVDSLEEKRVGADMIVLENATIVDESLPAAQSSTLSFLAKTTVCIPALVLSISVAGILLIISTLAFISCSQLRKRIYKFDN